MEHSTHPQCKNILCLKVMYNKEDKAVETKKIKLKKKKQRFLHRGKHKHSYQLFKISPAKDLQSFSICVK